MIPVLLDFFTVFFIFAGLALVWLNLNDWRRNRADVRVMYEDDRDAWR
jgi:hypothetical protein